MVLFWFLWFIIGLKWLIKAWGWIPILFSTFFELFGFSPNVGPSLDPLFIAEILLKIAIAQWPCGLMAINWLAPLVNRVMAIGSRLSDRAYRSVLREPGDNIWEKRKAIPSPALSEHTTLLGRKNITECFVIFESFWNILKRHFQNGDGIILLHEAPVKSKFDGSESWKPRCSWCSDFWNP